MRKRSNLKKRSLGAASAVMVLLLLTSVLSLSSCQKKEDGYTLGLGVFIEENTDKLSIGATAAAVVTDTDGRIVLCRVDCSEASASISGGKVTATGTDKTKYEQGNTLSVGEGKYWYSGANYFEGYVKGKTLADIEALEKADKDGTLDKDFLTGCATDPTGLIGALKRAMISEHGSSFAPTEALTAGIGIDTNVKGDAEGVTFVYGIAATAVSDGKIVASVIDAAEAEITLADGKGKDLVYAGTKLELGDGYGMVKNGGAAAEWYVQSENYAKTAEGRSPDKLSELPVENVSGCTIDARPLKDALIRAKQNLR